MSSACGRWLRAAAEPEALPAPSLNAATVAALRPGSPRRFCLAPGRWGSLEIDNLPKLATRQALDTDVFEVTDRCGPDFAICIWGAPQFRWSSLRPLLARADGDSRASEPCLYESENHEAPVEFNTAHKISGNQAPLQHRDPPDRAEGDYAGRDDTFNRYLSEGGARSAPHGVRRPGPSSRSLRST